MVALNLISIEHAGSKQRLLRYRELLRYIFFLSKNIAILYLYQQGLNLGEKSNLNALLDRNWLADDDSAKGEYDNVPSFWCIYEISTPDFNTLAHK